MGNHAAMRKSKEGNRSRLLKQLERIYKRDRGICHRCRKQVAREDASRDHVKPLSICTIEEARSDDNILLAHIECNNERGNAPMSPYHKVENKRQVENHLTYKIGDIYSLRCEDDGYFFGR